MKTSGNGKLPGVNTKKNNLYAVIPPGKRCSQLRSSIFSRVKYLLSLIFGPCFKTYHYTP